MGDRANIVMNQRSAYAEKQGQKPQRLFFYTHGDGWELPTVLQEALKVARAGSRLEDEQYLARIVFCQMVKDAYSETTGYGNSTTQGDGGYDLLVVDSDKLTVHLEKDDSDDRVVTHGPWTFEQYIDIDLGDNAWGTLRGEQPEIDED